MADLAKQNSPAVLLNTVEGTKRLCAYSAVSMALLFVFELVKEWPLLTGAEDTRAARIAVTALMALFFALMALVGLKCSRVAAGLIMLASVASIAQEQTVVECLEMLLSVAALVSTFRHHKLKGKVAA